MTSSSKPMPARTRGWTMAADHGRLEPASLRGDLLRVARQGLGRSNGRVPFPPAPKLMRLHLPASQDDDGTDDCACGADDVALCRRKFRNGRFQMIDDTTGVRAGEETIRGGSGSD